MTKCCGIKVAQLLPKVAQIVETVVLTYNDPFWNSPKSHQSFWADFVSKFVAKNFKKNHPIWSHWLLNWNFIRTPLMQKSFYENRKILVAFEVENLLFDDLFSLCLFVSLFLSSLFLLWLIFVCFCLLSTSLVPFCWPWENLWLFIIMIYANFRISLIEILASSVTLTFLWSLLLLLDWFSLCLIRWSLPRFGSDRFIQFIRSATFHSSVQSWTAAHFRLTDSTE